MQIIIEKKKENGDKVSVRISLNDSYGKLIINDVGIIPKGKRKEVFLTYQLSNDYTYRGLSPKERRNAELKLFIDTLGLDLMNECLLEAWEQLKPQPLTEKDLISE